MRKLRSLFPATAILLILGCTSASAAPQDCCHSSAHKTERPDARANTPAAPLSLLGTEDLRKEFNASSQKIRIVALLSPTCAECQSGHAIVGGILKKFSSPKLQALLVWEPMRDGDSSAAAAEQAEMVRDLRISQGWDGSRDVGKLFGATLDLDEIAWDVYLIYKPGIRWDGQQPPHPTFWMHQLTGADPSLLLCVNPSRLSTEVEKLLDRLN
jgi:hypothetical protein